MLLLLAQAGAAQPAAPRNIFEVMSALLFTGDTLTHGRQVADTLQSLSMVWGVVFLIAGLACVLHGYRYYKAVTIILAAMIGAMAGYYMGERIGAGYIVAGCLALLLGVFCWPLMKYAVAVIGGLAGAFIGANLWAASANIFFQGEQAAAMAQNYWVGALVGLMLLGLLAFILFKLSVVTFTSVSGSTIAVLGGLSLLLQVPAWQGPVVSGVSAHPIIIPLLVLVPTAIGILLQHLQPAPAHAGGDKPKKDAKPAAG